MEDLQLKVEEIAKQNPTLKKLIDKYKLRPLSE